MCQNLFSQAYPFQVIPALIMKLLGEKKSKKKQSDYGISVVKRQDNQWEIDAVKNRVEPIL